MDEYPAVRGDCGSMGGWLGSAGQASDNCGQCVNGVDAASSVSIRQEASVVVKEPGSSEARELRKEIRNLRAEADEALTELSVEQQERRRQWRNQAAEHAKRFAERRKEQGIELSEDELKLEFTPETLLEESTAEKLPKHIYDLFCTECEKEWERAQEAALLRIQARKMLLEALEKSSATDAELEEVKHFFTELDEFDRSLELRNYATGDLPKFDGKVLGIIHKAREVSSAGPAWKNLERTFREDGLGSFVLLPEDYERLHNRANETEDDDDDE